MLLRLGEMPLTGLHCWVGLLAGLQVQAELLGDHLPVWVGLLVLFSAVRWDHYLSSGYHLQLGKVPDCVCW